jgi:hypothetical protein
MGLDMYLYRAETNKNVHDETDFCECLKCRPYLKWIEEGELGYWRKANAIHNWFVTKLANGVDECQQIEVSRDDLYALLADVETELRNKPDEIGEDEPNTVSFNMDGQEPKDTAQSLADILTLAFMEQQFSSQPQVTEEHPLPPASGFFFGSTGRGEYYYEYLAETRDILKIAIAQTEMLDEDEAIIYQASW